MLPAQVSYWTLQENKRHNLATEELSSKELEERIRHDKADEEVRFGTLEETRRNNLYGNRLGDMSLGVSAYDAATRKFAAVADANYKLAESHTHMYQAESGRLQAYAAQTSASAAVSQAAASLKNAETNAYSARNKAFVDRMDAYTRQSVGKSQSALNYANADSVSSLLPYDMAYKQSVTDKNTMETDIMPQYLADRQKQTDIQQQNAYTNQFGKILDNLTPWQ